MRDDPDDIEALTVVKLWTLLASFERRLAGELAELGLSVAAFRLIGEVMREPDGVRQGELARRLGVRPPTVSAAVARLEQDGLVRRVPDSEDLRARRVQLVPDASLLPGVEVLQRMESLLVEGLGDSDRERLDGALALLADRLRTDAETPR